MHFSTVPGRLGAEGCLAILAWGWEAGSGTVPMAVKKAGRSFTSILLTTLIGFFHLIALHHMTFWDVLQSLQKACLLTFSFQTNLSLALPASSSSSSKFQSSVSALSLRWPMMHHYPAQSLGSKMAPVLALSHGGRPMSLYGRKMQSQWIFWNDQGCSDPMCL